jgi:hypothetical protein
MLDVSSASRIDFLSVPLLVRVSLAELYGLTDSACYFQYRHARDGVGAHFLSGQKNIYRKSGSFRIAMFTNSLAQLVIGIGLSLPVADARAVMKLQIF